MANSEGSAQKSAADAAVNKYIPWAMGLGFVPIPLVVIGGLSGIQLKMVSDIAKIYGVKFSENRAKSIVLSLLGGVVPSAATAGGLGGLVAAIPMVGVWLLPATMPLLAGAATYAVGKTFVQHFESGGTFLTFDTVGSKQIFAEKFAEGKAQASKFASSLNTKLAHAIDI